MEILAWLVVGLIAGWLASVIMKTNEQQGILADILLGIVGAFVGGFIVDLIGLPEVNGFSVYSVLVAVLGAIVVIWIGRLIRGSTARV